MSNRPPFALARIGNVMLGVTDLAASRGFYRDSLGLRVSHETPEFVFLDAGGVTLVLSRPLATVGESLVGATEIVFVVPGVQEAYEALSSRGVAFLREPRQVTATDWAANFTDPDGHKLTVFGPLRRGTV